MTSEKFKSRMKAILGDEYDSFIFEIENRDAIKGARVNETKISTDEFLKITKLDVTPISYTSDGFILNSGDGVGNTPEHHSGMIYIQDPGAMATANALDIKNGYRVLDMCAAPGGKSGQAASKIGDGGFLLSNEFVPKRAKIIVSNFERLGIKNAIVTSLDTSELPKLFSDFFDLVIADVPCSGEGMFRKSSEALDEWSEENVESSAKRQKEILKNAPSLVKRGGYLLYSTCTYSIEENEAVVDDFLKANPDFSLVDVLEELKQKTSDGIIFQGAYSNELNKCRRFYPHKSLGEGQFIALMQRASGSSNEKILYKDTANAPSKEEALAIKKFFSENLIEEPRGKAIKVGENLVFSSHGMPIPPRSVFSAGVLLGTVEKGRLIPSHQFFSAYGNLFIRRENLSAGDARIAKYLHGEEIDAKEIDTNGYCVVTYEGVSLGGGKASLGKIKNHYPKGLRTK